MSVARGSTGSAHRLVVFTGCSADSVLHTDSVSGSSGFGYYVRLKLETATTPEQSEGKPSPDSRVAASLWNTSLQTMTVAASRLALLNGNSQRWPVLSLEDFEPRQGQAFWRAKLLRPGGTSSDAALVVGVRTREPPHFFSLNSEKMGIPRLPLTTHLPYPPLWPQL